MRGTFDHWLKEHAVRFEDETLRAAPVAPMLREKTLTPLAQGIQHRVYRIEGEPWVVKEGRWDLELALFEDITLPLHVETAEAVLKQFSFSFLPKPEQVRDQHDLYSKASEYLGFGDDDAALAGRQRATRERLRESAGRLRESYALQAGRALEATLKSDAAEHDFLPKEHLLYGESFSTQNEGKETFFRFQEFVNGETLHDCDPASLTDARRDQLIVFLALLLLMYDEKGIVPDTRPRFVLSEAHDWISKTDNLLFGERGLTLIDTGWFWERNAPLVRRGFFMPQRTASHAASFLERLTA